MGYITAKSCGVMMLHCFQEKHLIKKKKKASEYTMPYI